MGSHNIDTKIKEVIDESGNFYDLQADKSKNDIWLQVQKKQRGGFNPFLLRALAAACILLFITTFAITSLKIGNDRKMETLVELNNSLQNQITANKNDTIIHKNIFAESYIIKSDTVVVEKIVWLNKTVTNTNRITDTIYIERTASIDNNQALNIATVDNNDLPADTSKQLYPNGYGTQILISNNTNVNKKRDRKFKFIFGGNRSRPNGGNLALKAEL